MRKLLFRAWMAGMLIGWAGAVLAQETPRVIIEKAIKAHGGEERLSKIRADKVKLKGVLYHDKQETPFTGETLVQLPSQFKNVVEFTRDGRKFSIVQVLNGDKVYVTINGQPQTPEEAALNEIRDTMLLDRAVRLTPLLADKIFNLSPLEEIKVNDRPAVGVKVSVKGRKDMRLYFDKETYLLMKTEHTLTLKDKDNKEKEIRQEEYYTDFKEYGGYKRPVKLLAVRNGAKIMEVELVDAKYLDKIDDSEFAKP